MLNNKKFNITKAVDDNIDNDIDDKTDDFENLFKSEYDEETLIDVVDVFLFAS
jgi:hypothetical protein